MRRKTQLISLVSVAVWLLTLLAATNLAIAQGGGGAPRVTTLSGAEEMPGPGDPDGSGFASIRLNHGQSTVCWEISYQNIAAPTAAHIHAAPVGVAGPVVVPLSPIEAGCTKVNRTLIKAIIQDPELYYVNVHNAEFPAGALRGQLSNRGQSE
jgi:hypothetical protein